MKTIGLIGGTSWVSTIDYYRLINEGINEKLGGSNFAKCMIHSFNYADIRRNNDANDWDATLRMITEASQNLHRSGAEAIILCANTMHLIAERLQPQLQIPVIHIAKVTADEIVRQRLGKVGLLGTKFTMERDFFKDKLKEQNIEAIIPGDDDRAFIHETIFEELGRGLIVEKTKHRYLEIIGKLVAGGAQGIILGCTEIPLLIKPSDVNIPLLDTTELHAGAAVKFMLS
jgi:aspartate racemase